MVLEKGGRKCKFVLLMLEIDQPRQHHIGEVKQVGMDYDLVQPPLPALLVPSLL